MILLQYFINQFSIHYVVKIPYQYQRKSFAYFAKIMSKQVPVLSVINSGPNNHYGIDRIPVCTGSGMYRLHCSNKRLE